MKIAILGVGNLGFSIARGIIDKKEVLACSSLYLTKRNPDALNKFFGTEDFISVTSDNREAVRNSEIIIVAVLPDQIKLVLDEVKEAIDSKKHTLISVATGRKIVEIEAIVSPDVPVIRAMPNTAISVGESMTCLSANRKGNEKISLAESVFNTLGQTLNIEEKHMQAATVICASGIAFWMRLIRATTQGAVQLGFHTDEAQQLSMQTCLGAAKLLIESQSHPEQEIDKVTTPSGCTIEGLNAMEHKGLSSSLIQGLVASYAKISEI